MNSPVNNPYREANPYLHVIGGLLILVAIAAIGIRAGENEREIAWYVIMILMVGFAAVVGHAANGSWRSVLIDGRNRISLRRLQLLAWSLVVLSALLVAVLSNVRAGWLSPLEITIPSQLWVLMGISTASAVAATAVLGKKMQQPADAEQLNRLRGVFKGTADANLVGASVVLRNPEIGEARWSNVLCGDEAGNGQAVDLGKIQLFFITFILLVGYSAAIAAMFREVGPITALPPVDDGMNVLLGISHTGYVADKAAIQSG